MIIELFGPPGVGKTTLAFALVDRLQKRGWDVKSVFSYRPNEDPRARLKDSTRPSAMAAMRRLLRSAIAIEMLSSVGYALVGPREVGVPANLMRLLPPKNIVWSIRLHQYMSRLARSWSGATDRNQLALFDQGFAQAVCSLAFLSKTTNQDLLVRALRSAPKADLLIRLHAPRDILEARLAERHRRQSRFEQLFELDLNATQDWVRLIDQLYELMQRDGRPIICVDSVDERTLCDAVNRIEGALVASCGPDRAMG